MAEYSEMSELEIEEYENNILNFIDESEQDMDPNKAQEYLDYLKSINSYEYIISLGDDPAANDESILMSWNEYKDEQFEAIFPHKEEAPIIEEADLLANLELESTGNIILQIEELPDNPFPPFPFIFRSLSTGCDWIVNNYEPIAEDIRVYKKLINTAENAGYVELTADFIPKMVQEYCDELASSGNITSLSDFIKKRKYEFEKWLVYPFEKDLDYNEGNDHCFVGHYQCLKWFKMDNLDADMIAPYIEDRNININEEAVKIKIRRLPNMDEIMDYFASQHCFGGSKHSQFPYYLMPRNVLFKRKKDQVLITNHYDLFEFGLHTTMNSTYEDEMPELLDNFSRLAESFAYKVRFEILRLGYKVVPYDDVIGNDNDTPARKGFARRLFEAAMGIG